MKENCRSFFNGRFLDRRLSMSACTRVRVLCVWFVLFAYVCVHARVCSHVRACATHRSLASMFIACASETVSVLGRAVRGGTWGTGLECVRVRRVVLCVHGGKASLTIITNLTTCGRLLELEGTTIRACACSCVPVVVCVRHGACVRVCYDW